MERSSTLRRSLNVNEEYLAALRTNSYAEFYSRAQQLYLRQDQSSASFADFLLEPPQETITRVLETAAIFSKQSDLKDLVFNYFSISTDASKTCTRLLRSINQTQSNHQIIQKVLELTSDFSPEQCRSTVSDLDSFNQLANPFSDHNPRDFQRIHDRYASILDRLRSKQKSVVRKIKLIKSVKKLAGACFAVAICTFAVAAVMLAVHTFAGILAGPVLMGCSGLTKKKKKTKKFSGFQVFKAGFLKRLGEQLDVAAKGTYILNRDFDTIGRLVARLNDEIEHNKAMIRFCLERREARFPLQEVVKELRKNDYGFRKKVEELEEHIYLCLLTINRARVLVIQKISAHCVENVEREHIFDKGESGFEFNM